MFVMTDIRYIYMCMYMYIYIKQHPVFPLNMMAYMDLDAQGRGST